ncbi:MAG: ArnT family glycosyltransferase [Candidatus Binatia bacterium]
MGWSSFKEEEKSGVVAGIALRDSFPWHGPVLVLLCSLLFFFPIQDLPFSNKGEAREAVVVQAIVNQGNWLFPLRPSGRLPSKPPLFHWVGALASTAYGTATEATVRFPSAFFATLGVLLIYLLGRRMFGADCGFWAAVILATSLDYHFLGVSARVDMTLTFFVTLSMALFYFLHSGYLGGPFWQAVFYAVLGVSVLAKGPISVVFVVLVVGLFFAREKRWSEFWQFLFHRMMLLTVLIVAFWYGLAVLKDGEHFIQKQIVRENLTRFWAFGAEGARHEKPFYYYLPYLMLNGLPWTFFLPFVVVDSFKRHGVAEQSHRFLVAWVIGIFLFLSASAGKRPDYLLPLYPALALLISQWFSRQGEPGRKSHVALTVMGGFFLLVALLSLGLAWDFGSPGLYFLDFFSSQLRSKDQQQVVWVARGVAEQRWLASSILVLFCGVSLFLSRALFQPRLQAVRVYVLVLAVLGLVLGQCVFLRAIAEGKSYASFMSQVRKELDGDGKLYVYGHGFDKNQILFYQGGEVPVLDVSPEKLAERLQLEDDLIILTGQQWKQIAVDHPIPAPLVKSEGLGPDGDASLVLIRGEGQPYGGGGEMKG